jgi:hypothetical protein
MMTNWNGTILGPPHVSLRCSDGLLTCVRRVSMRTASTV